MQVKFYFLIRILLGWGYNYKYDLSKVQEEEFSDFVNFCEDSDEEIRDRGVKVTFVSCIVE